MKKNGILIVLSVVGAALLIASFPLRDMAGNGKAADVCRIAGFAALLAGSALRLSRKK